MASVSPQTQQWPLSTSPATTVRSRPLTIALWVASVAAAGLFLMAGTAKLTGAPAMVQIFDTIGLGQWFRYLTGTIEVVAGVGLLVPPVALYAALALAATMTGAVFTHLAIVGGNPAVALTLLVATTFIAWTRWNRR